MAMTLGDILINVKADTSQLVTGFNRAESSITKTTQNMTNAVKVFAAAYISLNAIDLAKKYAHEADAMTNVNSKLKLVTASTKELAEVQKETYKISQDTRSVFTGNIELYQRIAMSTKTLNLSQKEMLELTKTINQAMTISGTTAAGAQALVVQLGQAFSSNFQAVAQELGTIRDQAPRLYQAMLDGTGKSAAEFKKMAEAGQLSSKMIIDALQKQGIAVDSDFGKMVMTIDGASTKIQNAITTTIGKIDEMSGISTTVATEISNISKSIDEMNPEAILEVSRNILIVSGSIATTVVAIKAYNTTMAIAATATALYGGELGFMNRALIAATISTRALSVATRLIPFVAIAGTIALLADNFLTARDNNALLNDTLETTTDKLKTLTKAQLDYRKLLLETGLQEDRNNAQTISANLKKEKYGLFGGAPKNNEETKRLASELDTINAAILKKQELLLQFKAIQEGSPLNKEESKKPSPKATELTDKEIKAAKEAAEEKQKLQEEMAENGRSMVYQLTKESIEKDKERVDARIALDKMSFEINQEYEKKKQELEDDWAKTVKDNYSSMLDTQIELASSTQDWQNGLTGVASEIMAVSNAMSKMHVNDLKAKKAQFDMETRYEDAFTKYAGDEYKTKQLVAMYDQEQAAIKEANRANEINGLANLAGAMSETFEDGSDAAKAFSALQQVLAIANLAQSTAFTSLFVTQEAVKTQAAGTTAVAIAAQSSPWTGLATAADMVAMLASLGVTLGVSIGSGTTNTYDTHSAQEANTGTETDALKNSLEILSDFAKPEFRLLSQMNDSLMSIDYALSGTATNLSRTGGFAMGEGYNNTLSSTNQNVNTTASAAILGGPIGIGTLAVSELTKNIFGENPISNIIDSVIGSFGSFIGGIGGTTTSKSITDAGITFGNQLLTDALDDLSGYSYQTIKTRTKKSGWFSDSTTNSYNTQYGALAEETDNEFELILNSLYDTVVMAGEGLNIATSAIDEELAGFYVNLGKISLKGKSDEQIQKLLTDIFGEISDNMAIDAIPLIEGFKNIGEGYFETLVRVSSGVQEAEYYINRLGGAFEEIAYTDILNQQGNVGFEALSQSIIKADEATYGLGNGVVQMIESMNVAADELYDTYIMFEQVRLQIEATNQSVNSLTSSMLLGAGGADQLQSGLSDYIDNFLTDAEQFAYHSKVLEAEFTKMNLAMPTTIEGFRSIVEGIDTSTSAGQELYGRLITLSGEYSDVFSDLTDSLSENIEEMKKQLSDAWLSEYSPLSVLQKTEYANNLAFNPESSGLSAIDASYLALQTAAKTATRDEDIALAFSNYTALLEEQVADASRQDIVDVLDKVSSTLNDIVDRIERIEQIA